MQRQILNRLYSEYISEKITRAELEGHIYKYLMFNQANTCLSHWKQDEYEDYVSWLYPRLHKAIDNYRDIGSSFEAFMFKFIKVSSKEYRVRTVTNAITEYSVWSAEVPDMYTREDAPAYIHELHSKPSSEHSSPMADNIENAITYLLTDKKGRKDTRRILALLLKCYYFISEDFAERIAPRIGIKPGELTEMLKKIRIIRQKKDDKIYFMKERIHSQFLRCLIYEKRLSLIKENSSACYKLKIRLQKARKRLEKMRDRVTSIRVEATNNQVAGIIGITKGTVDASLHKLKVKWKVMSKNAGLN